MIQFFTHVRKAFFIICLCVPWLILVCINLLWNPFFLPPVKAEKGTKLLNNQDQKQTIVNTSPGHPFDLFPGNSLEPPPILYNGPGGTLLKFQVKADFLETFNPDIDILQSRTSQADDIFSSSRSASNASRNRFEILRLKEKLKGFNYGLEYRYVGRHVNEFECFKNKSETKTNFRLENDQEGVEVWGEKNIRSIGLKTFFSRFWDNVDRDPGLPRMLTHRYGLEMKYKMDLFPVNFSLSHSREKSEDTFEPGRFGYQGKYKTTYNSSIQYHGGKVFDIRASASYSFSHDLFDPNRETQSFCHAISSAIHPTTNLTITPTLSFGEYRYLWDGEHKENPSASLLISYRRFFDLVDLSLRGGYSQTQNLDRSLDTERLNTSIGLSWNANYSSFPKMSCSLDLGYNKYLDKTHQNSSHNTLSTSFKLEFQL